MKDSKGLYYYPDPVKREVRVYVRKGEAEPEFRLWHQDNDEMWERHGWVPYSAIKAAANMYKASRAGSDPLIMYDIEIAKTLIRDDKE